MKSQIETSPTATRDFPRWAELNLADPPRDGQLPEQGQTADVLMHALTLPGATDPVEGIFEAMRAEDEALSVLFMSRARRGSAAILLLRRADERAPTPEPPGEDNADREEPEPAGKPA